MPTIWRAPIGILAFDLHRERLESLRVSLPKELVDQFHARVVAQGPESLVLEATGTPAQIDALVEILRPCVILEMARTGRVAMVVGPPLRFDQGNATEQARFRLGSDPDLCVECQPQTDVSGKICAMVE